MNPKTSLGDITPSICEAAFERCACADNSLAEQIKQNSIEVRDFIVLSFVCDQDELSIGQISGILRLSRDQTEHCIGRLLNADLVQFNVGENESECGPSIRVTPTGRLMALRIHGLQT